MNTATPFNTYRDAIVVHLKSSLPAQVSVEAHGGRLDEAEVRRLSLAAPALVVSILGVDGLENRGGSNAVTSVGVFVVTSVGKKGESPDDAALAITATVLAAISGQRFGCDVATPASVRAENYSSGELQAAHVALWGVTWKAGVDVENALAAPELDDFLRCYVREKTDGPTTVEIHVQEESA